MKRPEDADWDEFKDPEIVDWKRVRAAIEHENELTNHRQTWLLTSQAFLLTAFGWVFRAFMENTIAHRDQVYQWVLSLFCFAGIFLCAHLRLGLLAAREQHAELERWWDVRPKQSQHPRLCGQDPRVVMPLPYASLTVVFIILWLLLLAAVFSRSLIPYSQLIVRALGITVAVSGILALVFQLGWRKGRREARG